MDLSPNFLANLQDAYKDTGKAWLHDLAETITKLCDKHGCRFIKPMPDLTYHFVGLVEILATGENAILKMAPTSENVEREAKWLRCFDKDVPIIYWFDDEYHAYLMEQIVPGKSLKYLVKDDDDKATSIICQVIRDLHDNQHKVEGFKHLSELAIALPGLKRKIEDKILTKTQALFAALTEPSATDVLLHGDLHHDNILSSGNDYKVIDPHGYIGDPAFASSVMIYNPRDCFPQDKSVKEIIQRRLSILCDELPYDAHRIKAWTLCMTILSIAWSYEDYGAVPASDLEVAKIIDKLI